MPNVLSNIGKDAVILFIGTVSTSALGFFLLPLYTQSFSVVEYGTIELVNIAAQMAAIIMALGMPSAFNREFLQLSDTQDQRKEVISTSYWFINIYSLLITIIMCSLSKELSIFLDLDSTIVPTLFEFVFIKTYFLTIGLISLRYLIVTRKLVSYVLLSFGAAASVMLVSVWVLLILEGGLYDLFYYQMLVFAIFGVGHSVFLVSTTGFRVSMKRLRSMLVFALPMVPSAISYYIMSSSDIYFLQKFGFLEDVGRYAVACKIGLLLFVLIVGPVTTALSPYIYKLAERDDFGSILRQMLELVCFVFFSCAIGLSLVSPYLIQLLSPPEYWAASNIVIWISVAYALYGLNFVLVASINTSGKSYYQMIAIVIGAISNLIFNSLLIPSHGMMGAAIATVIAYLIQTVLTAIFAQRLKKIPYRFIRTSMVAFLIFISYWPLNQLGVEDIMVLYKLVLYLIYLVLILKLFFDEEVNMLWKKYREKSTE